MQTLKKILELAKQYELDELSFAGIYLKRGGPAKPVKAEPKAAKKEKPDLEVDDLAEIDKANEPIMDAFRQSLGV